MGIECDHNTPSQAEIESLYVQRDGFSPQDELVLPMTIYIALEHDEPITREMVSDLWARYVAQENQTVRLRSALQVVEWIESEEGNPRYCHACAGWENHGHYDDCPIKRALASPEGDDDAD